jgi:hypothetical protein
LTYDLVHNLPIRSRFQMPISDEAQYCERMRDRLNLDGSANAYAASKKDEGNAGCKRDRS